MAEMFSDKMDDDSTSVGSCVFRGVEYVVTVQIQNGNSLMVEVEDRVTADQWRATFDSTYVEDLTHKTGNFKQFSIFVNMLESALSQTSDCVSLDLMTYGDLESLRQRKAGVRSTIPTARTAALNTKRYLILTYTVEFDRIHYPLPLPYMGKPDPRALQETIRQLRAEIKNLKQQGSTDFKYKELEKLQKDYKTLGKDKEELESQFLQYRRELKHTTEGHAVKEIRMLKSVVKNQEEEIMKEKTRHQRSTSKRGQEYRELLEEVEELRASERNLRVRVKSLTNELAVYKRQAATAHKNVRPASRERSFERVSARDRSLSYARERSLSRDRVYSRPRSGSRERPSSRERPGSRERPSSAPIRSRNPNYSASSEQRSYISMRSARSRSPSPAGARNPRFDPTAYVKDRQRRKDETDMRRHRQSRSSRPNSAEKKKTGLSPLNSSRYSARSQGSRNRSRTGSVGSRGELSDGGMSESKLRIIKSRQNREVLKPNNSQNSSYSTREPRKDRSSSRDRKKMHILSSTPDATLERRRAAVSDKENEPDSENEADYYDRSAEISEIDARLNRLQKLMKTSMQ